MSKAGGGTVTDYSRLSQGETGKLGICLNTEFLNVYIGNLLRKRLLAQTKFSPDKIENNHH